MGNDRYNPLTALWKSMKFPPMAGWAVMCLALAAGCPDKEIALGFVQCGTAVVCFYLAAQGYQDGQKGKSE